jgi:polygalacturonase
MLFEDNSVFNGDDCLTVGSPAKNIHFRNSYCNGGHGLSIGSLGKGGAVADVQNVLYVVRMLVELGSLTLPSKDRKCYHGMTCIVFSNLEFTYLVQENSQYGARFKSWTGGRGIARKYDDCFYSE